MLGYSFVVVYTVTIILPTAFFVWMSEWALAISSKGNVWETWVLTSPVANNSAIAARSSSLLCTRIL